MERKSCTVSLKADTPGSLTAVFSTLGTADHDGDVTLKGAFQNGAETRLLPSHDWSSPMIGKGTIRETGNTAVFDGAFNLNMQAGREWYESLKFDAEHGNPLQEFSYGYDVLDSEQGTHDGKSVRFLKKLKVHEVSPVTLGAGIGTHTVRIKALVESGNFEELFAYFEEHPDEASAFTEQLAAKNFGSVVEIKADGSHEPMTGSHTHPHPAFGAQGGDMTHAHMHSHDNNAVHDHAHAPKGEGEEDHGQKFTDHAEHVLADVQALTARAAGILALRAQSKEGRTFSSANVTKLSSLADQIESSAGKLRELLVAPEAPKSDRAEEIERLYARFTTLDSLYHDLARA